MTPFPRIVFLLLLALSTTLTACDDPGEGRNFERARAEVETVIEAIRRYHLQTGQLPKRLDALMPTYLPNGYLMVDRPGRAVSYLDYRLMDADTFEFEFGYHGPGTNRCALKPETSPSQWECWGHY